MTAPVCHACLGVGSDPVDGSECAACEGTRADWYDPSSASDRAEVARRIVADFGALAACEAAGLRLDWRDPQADYRGARRDFASCFADDFGSVPYREIGRGVARVTTLVEAMREAVKGAAVLYLLAQVEEARASGDDDATAVADTEAIVATWGAVA